MVVGGSIHDKSYRRISNIYMLICALKAIVTFWCYLFTHYAVSVKALHIGGVNWPQHKSWDDRQIKRSSNKIYSAQCRATILIQKKIQQNNTNLRKFLEVMVMVVSTLLSTLFPLYHGGQFYWWGWGGPEYRRKPSSCHKLLTNDDWWPAAFKCALGLMIK